MKPLSKRQREVLQEMKDYGSSINDATCHIGTLNALINSGHVELYRVFNLVRYYTITKTGLTALAKPTRKRGKKKKPDLGNPHKQIMV